MLGTGALGELALGEIPSGAAPEPVLEAKFHLGYHLEVGQRRHRCGAPLHTASLRHSKFKSTTRDDCSTFL
jgi:hypothetical protein